MMIPADTGTTAVAIVASGFYLLHTSVEALQLSQPLSLPQLLRTADCADCNRLSAMPCRGHSGEIVAATQFTSGFYRCFRDLDL